jgi:hypothetical protein
MKNFLIFLIFIFKFSYADDFISIYFYPVDNNDVAITSKLYSIFYEDQHYYHSRSKEKALFLIEYFDTTNSFENSNKILENYQFDYINFIDSIDYTNENEEILKKFKEKFLCFNCLEKYAYLFNKYKTINFNNIKIILTYFKNCNFNEEEIKKLLYLNEDTNLWIFAFRDSCNIDFINNYYNEKNIFIIFYKNIKNHFYKKNINIYICNSFEDICKIKIKFREGTILNLENNFINLYKYEKQYK